KAHIARARHQRLRYGNGLLAGRLHVETGLALPLRPKQSLIEHPCQQHGAQARQQRLRRNLRRPRPDRRAAIIEHPDQLERQLPHRVVIGQRLRARYEARWRNMDMAEVRLVAGPGRRRRDMQLQFSVVSHASPSQAWFLEKTMAAPQESFLAFILPLAGWIG